MKKENSNSITNSELDQLLAMAALNIDLKQIKNKEMMEVVANSTFKPAGFVYSSTKKIILLSTVCCAIVAVFWINLADQSTSSKALITYNSSANQERVEQKLAISDVNRNEASTKIQAEGKIKNDKNSGKIIQTSSQLLVTTSGNPHGQLKEVLIGAMPSDSAIKQQVENYVFPVLTEKEKKNNEKSKKQMLKYLSKINLSQYPRIISENGGETYHIKAAEVTNKEYRTFLFDLLIKDRKDEFLIAKPSQDLWLNAAGQTAFNSLAKNYFSDKKYDDYPVVNITQQGAEMFCKWLNEELNMLSASDSKTPKFEIRLPKQTEWVYAAKAGRPNAKYAWPLDSVQNRVHCFMANCCIQKLKTEIMHPICNNHSKYDESCYTSAGMMLRDSTVASVLVWSYNPSAYGLFTMCGNVSELVYIDNSTSTKAVGGNWASDFKHLIIDSESEFETNPGASPMIGFRICVKKVSN